MYLFNYLRLCTPYVCLHTSRSSSLCSFTHNAERETAHEVRGISVLRRPKPTLRGLRPRTFEARMCLVKRKKDIQMDVFFLFNESARRDSNPRPRPWQGRAPPTEPLAHVLTTKYTILQLFPIVNCFFNFFLRILSPFPILCFQKHQVRRIALIIYSLLEKLLWEISSSRIRSISNHNSSATIIR